jgi:ketosteroid isomerase-like protein
MKIIFCAAFILIGFICVCAQGKSVTGTKSITASKVEKSKDYQEIERLETVWNTINEVSDAEGKQRLLADDSYHVGNDGRFYDKNQDVLIQKAARERKQSSGSIVKFEISERRIRLYKDAAVVTGLGTTFVTKDGQTRNTGQFRFIHVWEKRGRGWQLAVDQTTAVRNPKMTEQITKGKTTPIQ